mmetsp:Transcript_9399/g.30027  ORF Transcript_9399/g.30027 Transcript_9399/m.30027 type:complete len:239 (-) Transcript_9399:224-940(-)
MKREMTSASRAMSRSAVAVLTVSAREWTKMRTWFFPAWATTFSKQILFMSWKRLMAFFSATPMYCCWSGTGRKELSKKKRPLAGSTRRSAATSAKLGSVAERPTRRTASLVVSTWRMVRATMVSRTGPRSSWTQRTTSCAERMSLRGPRVKVSPQWGLRVQTLTLEAARSSGAASEAQRASLAWHETGPLSPSVTTRRRPRTSLTRRQAHSAPRRRGPRRREAWGGAFTASSRVRATV